MWVRDLESVKLLFKEYSLCVHVGQGGGDATQDEPKDELPGHHHDYGVNHLSHVSCSQVSIACVCTWERERERECVCVCVRERER